MYDWFPFSPSYPSPYSSLYLATLCNHICRCLSYFDKTFYLFILVNFPNIPKSLNKTAKQFYVNCTIPMFLKHLGKYLILSCLQFPSLHLLHKEVLNPCHEPITGKRPFGSSAHASTWKSLAYATFDVPSAFLVVEIPLVLRPRRCWGSVLVKI